MKQIILIILALTLTFLSGVMVERKLTVDRAKELPYKDCFTNQDIEYILFNVGGANN